MADGDRILALRRYRSTTLGYVIAAGLGLAALALRFAVEGLITVPFITLFPALVIAAFVGGRWAGLGVAAVGGLVSWYFWLPPTRSFSLEWPTGWFNAFFYILTAGVLLYLVRRLNETLDALAAERDRCTALFSELQHRTANNLQSTAAMLDHGIRRVRAEPAAAVDILETAQHRFGMMSRIHRHLYDGISSEYRAIPHLRVICRDILETAGVGHIEISVGGDEKVVLNQYQMLTLSLVIVELLLNAIKHAFAENEKGRILIDLTTDGNVCTVSYRDDGKGLPDNAPERSTSRLGSRIMSSLAKQLGGHIEARTIERGYSCAVIFPIAQNSVTSSSKR